MFSIGSPPRRLRALHPTRTHPDGATMGRTRSARRLVRSVAVAVGLALVVTGCIRTDPGTELVSVTAGGEQLERSSFSSDISGDGRYVVFSSRVASPGEFSNAHVYRKDRSTGAVELVSVSDDGAPLVGRNSSTSISADGSRVAFTRTTPDERFANEIDVVFVRDIAAGRTFTISVTPNGSERNGENPTISSDGRFVAFHSSSPSLVAGDSNGRGDVFVRDIDARSTRIASVTHGGNPIFGGTGSERGTAISGDGRYVAFLTSANLTGEDTDSDFDIYVRDMIANTTTFQSIPGAGTAARSQVDMSDDGRFVAFVSPQGPFQAQAWVRDRVSRELRLISRRADGAQSNNVVFEVGISRDGAHVVFDSAASDLVIGDTNTRFDVFIAPSTGGPVERVSLDVDGENTNGHSQGPNVADGGKTLAYGSDATDLVEGDANAVQDIFVTRL